MNRSALSRDFSELFANAGLRYTKQRRALYEALARSKQHPTADELHHLVQTHLPGISLATVYNTLEALCGAGLAQKLPSANPGGSARYDADLSHHLHIRCSRTGAVADVPEDLSRAILDMIDDGQLAELEDRLGFTIQQVQVEFVGEYEVHTAKQ